MNNYENMTKEQLIAEIERLQLIQKEIIKDINIFAKKNRELHEFIRTMFFTASNAYKKLRNN
jgi:hypothetical protein